MTTQQDRDEFTAFCRGATDSQLAEIIAKESKARRLQFLAIAQTERARREERGREC